MESKEQFILRRNNNERSFENEIHVLANALKSTDCEKRDQFMSRQDTVDAVQYVDDILENNRNVQNGWRVPYLLSLLKHNADHHGVSYALPEHCQAEYRKLKRDAKPLWRRFF